MIICFSCSSETKVQLDGLIATGHYPDYAAALVAAIANLAVIHAELKGGTALVIDDLALNTVGSGQQRTSNETTGAAHRSIGAGAYTPDLPVLLRRPGRVPLPATVAVAGTEKLPADKPLPLNQWLFGQFNRLLPAKVTCRALVNLTAQGRNSADIETTAMEIARAAAQLGRYFVSLDEKRGASRDEALAIAFPDIRQVKSIQRFANQFVGSKNKGGYFLGLPASLKLVGPHPDHADRVALTEAGWNFGSLANPLLDGMSSNRDEKFASVEVSFLVDHILASVPAEALAYRTVLREIARGVATPEDLDDAIAGQQKGFGRPFVSTQRSGVICRMADLGLIARARVATRVSYVLLPRGTEFLRIMEAA